MNPKRAAIAVAITGVLVIIGALAWYAGIVPTALAPMTASAPQAATTTAPGAESAEPPPALRAYYPYGSVTLALGEAAGFESGLSIRPLSVLEDSRCPADVACIQAGALRVLLKVDGAGGEHETEAALGKPLTAGTETITLMGAAPERMTSRQPQPEEYRLTFRVESRRSDAPAAAPCYIGGCSSQLCTDAPGAVSTCEYRSEYACYRTAACERQANGACGWTQTPALAACLAHPSGL